MKALNYDYSRCYGSACTERESCLRFLAVESDRRITEPVRISYTDDLCYYDGVAARCDFTKVYKIEIIIEEK